MEEILLKGKAHHGTYFVTRENGNIYGYIVIPDKLPFHFINLIKDIKVPGDWRFDKYIVEEGLYLQDIENDSKESLHVLGFCPQENDITLDLVPFSDTWTTSDVASECVQVLKQVNKILGDIKCQIDSKFQ